MLITNEISWLSVINFIMTLIFGTASIYLSVITFTNRSSIEFLKTVFAGDHKQLIANTEHIRAVEALVNKLASDHHRDIYSMHSAAQIAVSLGLTKTQILWLLEGDYICADKINREWKMTEPQLTEARATLRDKLDAIKNCRNLEDLQKLFRLEEQQ